MPGKHRHHLGEAIAGRRRAADEIETKRAAEERAKTEGTDIARAVEKTNRATDAAWPSREEG